MYSKENYITNDVHLKQIIEKCLNEEIISIDTEFIRRNTFYPKLCLIQLATSDECFVIDVLKIKNLFPLKKLLRSNDLMKIFHSPRQDIEIFFNLFKILPRNIFDTQIAYSFLHTEYQISYEKLVFKLLNIKIDKTYQYFNWDLRPLTHEQLNYAVNDVFYLRKVFLKIKKILILKKRFNWALEESNLYLNKELYINNAENYWKNIYPSKTKNINISKLKSITTWRENKCVENDVSRKLVISDKNIIKLINNDKKMNPYLFSFEMSKNDKEFIMDVLKSTKKDLKLNEQHETDANTELFDIYKLILKLTSHEFKISSNLIAKSSELKKINTCKSYNLSVFKGWRNEIFGKKIKKFLNGELKIVKIKEKLALIQN